MNIEFLRNILRIDTEPNAKIVSLKTSIVYTKVELNGESVTIDAFDKALRIGRSLRFLGRLLIPLPPLMVPIR